MVTLAKFLDLAAKVNMIMTLTSIKYRSVTVAFKNVNQYSNSNSECIGYSVWNTVNSGY